MGGPLGQRLGCVSELRPTHQIRGQKGDPSHMVSIEQQPLGGERVRPMGASRRISGAYQRMRGPSTFDRLFCSVLLCLNI